MWPVGYRPRREDQAHSDLHDLMVDGAEDRAALRVVHLDPHAVTEIEVWRLRCAVQDGFHRAYFRQAGIADAAVGHGLARPTISVAVRHRAGADDGPPHQWARLYG